MVLLWPPESPSRLIPLHVWALGPRLRNILEVLELSLIASEAGGAWQQISRDLVSLSYKWLYLSSDLFCLFTDGANRPRTGRSWATGLCLPPSSSFLYLLSPKSPPWLPMVSKDKTLSGHMSYSEYNLKWIVDLHVKCKTMACLEGNQLNPQRLELEKDQTWPQRMIYKGKNLILDSIKINNFCSDKDTVKRTKTQASYRMG